MGCCQIGEHGANGPLLPLQLNQALGSKKFSYCLIFPTATSSIKAMTLVMGEEATENALLMGFMPMSVKPAVAVDLHYIDVLGFSVKNQRLNITANTFSINSTGGGGMILDSGTTYTYVQNVAFVASQQAFDASLHSIA
ncbi:hypothetical protein L7F22_024766 [Adiantum nelumboides]|nr:hypothetical protein [Adiantum nelumboides]